MTMGKHTHSQYITEPKLQLCSSNENHFMTGVTTIRGTVLKVTALGRLGTLSRIQSHSIPGSLRIGL